MTEVIDQIKQAIETGNAGALRSLLETHAELAQQVNAPLFAFGGRPINAAAQHREVLDVLIDAGADINARSGWSEGPYGIFDDGGCDEATARHVMKRGAILTPHGAARFGWLDELRAMLLVDRSLVHSQGGDGQRPLHLAKSPAVVDLLLEFGADVDARCLDHLSTPAQFAVADRPEVARHLLAAGATPDIFLAARLGDLQLISQQIDENPEVLTHVIGCDGYNRVPSCTTYQWNLGFHKSSHDVAREAKQTAAFDLLIGRSKPPQQFLARATASDVEAARQVLGDHANLLQSLSRDDHAHLAYSIFFSNRQAALAMVELDFDPAAPGIDGGSALHAAALNGDLELTAALLSRPAGVALIETPDPQHRSTPLGWCCYGSTMCCNPTGDYPAVARMLLDAGAKPGANLNDASSELRQILLASE